jgi:hypothetical protein
MRRCRLWAGLRRRSPIGPQTAVNRCEIPDTGLARARDKTHCLQAPSIAASVILVFIGAKFLLTDVVVIGVGLSLLSVIVLVMGAAIGASLLQERRRPGEPKPHPRAT